MFFLQLFFFGPFAGLDVSPPKILGVPPLDCSGFVDQTLWMRKKGEVFGYGGCLGEFFLHLFSWMCNRPGRLVLLKV